MILKHLKFSLPDTLVICFKKHKKPWYMTSRAWSVWSKITLRTSLVTPVGNKSHLIVKLVSFMNMVHFKIFFKSAFRKSGAEMRQSIYMSLNIKIKKSNSWYTVPGMHILFSYKMTIHLCSNFEQFVQYRLSP